ncbi:hypothetical protein AbraIFM66951_004649 [Aspergillus brasiliensis]|uniref:Uncharacterized protein n=1 Tax=Aspergillus brasiliensis TaxID=319629 RepID=A0A9W6DMV6_9EURO|nr:hypothetical protein AbraCBS73388_008576 [Aspergillus brasiliensis]GKZ50952.1 hypothetical protein AbraIFM66951_004649 [Aspergillus brasiliensis]
MSDREIYETIVMLKAKNQRVEEEKRQRRAEEMQQEEDDSMQQDEDATEVEEEDEDEDVSMQDEEDSQQDEGVSMPQDEEDSDEEDSEEEIIIDFLQQQQAIERLEESARQQQAMNYQWLVNQERLEGIVGQTTFLKYVQHCHESLRDAPKVDEPGAEGTTGDIPIPTTMVCPKRLEHWSGCDDEQARMWRRVCRFLEPGDGPIKKNFASSHAIREYAKILTRNPIQGHTDLEAYLHGTLHTPVNEILVQLCGIATARAAFDIQGDRINVVYGHEEDLQSRAPIRIEDSERQPPERGSFCIHDEYREIRGSARLLGEFKVPNKLTLEVLRAGLQPMDFYTTVVQNQVNLPTDAEKATYDATRLAGSAVVQIYNHMISSGLEYGYIATGEGLVLLRVPYDNPSTLFYRFCEPNNEVIPDDSGYLLPVTAVARVLCLYLMSCTSPPRSPDWCIKTRAGLHTWLTGFDYENYMQTPTPVLSDDPLGTPSPARRSSHGKGPMRQSLIQTRSQSTHARPLLGGASPNEARNRNRHPDSPMLSVPEQHPDSSSSAIPHPSRPFCTQRCLLSLKENKKLDDKCPNFALHQQGSGTAHHPTTAQGLVKLIKQEIEKCLDGIEPMGHAGSSGVPLKITCAKYGYTLVGKGTTCFLWPQLEREADVYEMLAPLQGYDVSVFLGKINMKQTYDLHGVGKIRHMLVMGWGGNHVDKEASWGFCMKTFGRGICFGMRSWVG